MTTETTTERLAASSDMSVVIRERAIRDGDDDTLAIYRTEWRYNYTRERYDRDGYDVTFTLAADGQTVESFGERWDRFAARTFTRHARLLRLDADTITATDPIGDIPS